MAGIPHSQLRAEAQPPTTAGHPALCPNNLGEGPYQSLNGSNALQFPSQAGIQGPRTGREGGILACGPPRKLSSSVALLTPFLVAGMPFPQSLPSVSYLSRQSYL